MREGECTCLCTQVLCYQHRLSHVGKLHVHQLTIQVPYLRHEGTTLEAVNANLLCQEGIAHTNGLRKVGRAGVLSLYDKLGRAVQPGVQGV